MVLCYRGILGLPPPPPFGGFLVSRSEGPVNQDQGCYGKGQPGHVNPPSMCRLQPVSRSPCPPPPESRPVNILSPTASPKLVADAEPVSTKCIASFAAIRSILGRSSYSQIWKKQVRYITLLYEVVKNKIVTWWLIDLITQWDTIFKVNLSRKIKCFHYL